MNNIRVSSSSSSSGGIGCVGLLQVALIVLKLTNLIDWSWWWVLTPTWASILLLIGFVCLLLAYAYYEYNEEQKRTLRRLKR